MKLNQEKIRKEIVTLKLCWHPIKPHQQVQKPKEITILKEKDKNRRVFNQNNEKELKTK